MEMRLLTRSMVPTCAQFIFDTSFGKNYYPTQGFLEHELKRGIDEDDCWIAIASDQIVGLVWFQRKGAFHSYPYLHLIFVRQNCQGRGVGHALMDFFEREILHDGSRKLMCIKAFLVVNSNNHSALSMYENRGYERIAQIDGLFRPKLNEILMAKTVVRHAATFKEEC